MSENKKPRIAEILEVEVGEPFEVDGYGSVNFYIDENGEACSNYTNDPDYCTAIYQAINHPDRIIRKPRWTEQEAELAKALYELRRSVSLVIGRSTGGMLWWRDGDRAEGILPHKLFPSLNEGDCVRLNEIIGGTE